MVGSLSPTNAPRSRAVVNELASTYLLPVIDVGVRVGSKADNRLMGLAAEVRVLTPETPCLWCSGSIDAQTIRAENLPADQRRGLEQEGYVQQGIGAPVPSVVALTVLGSALSTCALLTLISDEGEVVPPGFVVDGFFGDAFRPKTQTPIPGCRCRQQLGRGDGAAPPFFPEEQLVRS